MEQRVLGRVKRDSLDSRGEVSPNAVIRENNYPVCRITSHVIS